MEGESWGFKDWQLDINSAILRSFEISSNEVPILSLRTYLTQQNEKIFEIHHRKMEELVASVFREYFACEVKIVGKSCDGGIDLILIMSDNPILVQVKRRKTKLNQLKKFGIYWGRLCWKELKIVRSSQLQVIFPHKLLRLQEKQYQIT
ncbi:restriction endonuclease [Labilibaculum sp. K2S]|nr:restriction endonuclease [Labilibaculum sp. K2S]MDM8161479.1 restriction endonuclease [Labilibaculum sp. K2S]